MSDKHEVFDLSAVRKEQPVPAPSAVELAKARLQGKAFSQLTPAEKEDLLMVVGCALGYIVPESPEH